jgi:hypothetical protein
MQQLSYSGSGWWNELWKYTPSTNEWTWVSGNNTTNAPGVYGSQGIPSTLNCPGARTYAVSWIDSNGFLSLFGGDGYVWVSGNNTVNVLGVYGTQGIPSLLSTMTSTQTSATVLSSTSQSQTSGTVFSSTFQFQSTEKSVCMFFHSMI